MNLKASLFLMTGWCAFALTGCGNDGSGLDPDKRGEDLTREEARQLCQSFVDRGFDEFSEERYCKTEAFLAANRAYGDDGSDAAIQGACEAARNNCGSRYEGALKDFERDNDCSDAETVDDCSARVGDIETCINEQFDVLIARIDGLLECDEYSREAIERIVAQWEEEERNPPPPSEACRAVRRDCDDFEDFVDG